MTHQRTEHWPRRKSLSRGLRHCNMGPSARHDCLRGEHDVRASHGPKCTDRDGVFSDDRVVPVCGSAHAIWWCSRLALLPPGHMCHGSVAHGQCRGVADQSAFFSDRRLLPRVALDRAWGPLWPLDPSHRCLSSTETHLWWDGLLTLGCEPHALPRGIGPSPPHSWGGDSGSLTMPQLCFIPTRRPRGPGCALRTGTLLYLHRTGVGAAGQQAHRHSEGACEGRGDADPDGLSQATDGHHRTRAASRWVERGWFRHSWSFEVRTPAPLQAGRNREMRCCTVMVRSTGDVETRSGRAVWLREVRWWPRRREERKGTPTARGLAQRHCLQADIRKLLSGASQGPRAGLSTGEL